MFKAFTLKSLASLSLIAAIACIGAADPAFAKKKKQQPNIPGHWERNQDGGFEWVGKTSKKPKNVEPVVRDHRNGEDAGGGVIVNSSPVVRDHRKKIIPTSDSGGGVIVTSQPSDPIVRDHRDQPVVRDHRKKPLFEMGN
jgi:hypothetical protein